jgi:hypothetical protein
MADQIFISYSKKNRDYALRIYNDLLTAGYLAWIDERIEEGEKWRPQIDSNLKDSRRLIVCISPEAIESKWVHHEISMACGRDLDIIPVKIKEYRPSELPLGVEEIQLFNIVQGEVDYDRELTKLKNRLGTPIAIVEYMEGLLRLYETSEGEALLSEHQLKLYERHKEKIVWPVGKKTIGLEMIEKSYRAIQDYWDKYNDLETNYMLVCRENTLVRRENDRLHRRIEREKQRFELEIELEKQSFESERQSDEHIHVIASRYIIIVNIVLIAFAAGLLLKW